MLFSLSTLCLSAIEYGSTLLCRRDRPFPVLDGEALDLRCCCCCAAAAAACFSSIFICLLSCQMAKLGFRFRGSDR